MSRFCSLLIGTFPGLVNDSSYHVNNDFNCNPQVEGRQRGSGDVRTSLLQYQLDTMIEQWDHARKIADLNARMLNEVASRVLGEDELNEPTNVNLGD